jgi:hypothetical protein
MIMMMTQNEDVMHKMNNRRTPDNDINDKETELHRQYPNYHHIDHQRAPIPRRRRGSTSAAWSCAASPGAMLQGQGVGGTARPTHWRGAARDKELD